MDADPTDAESELIYIAKRLSDATRLEAILKAGGVEYEVEPDEYQGGLIFRRTRIGAFFYVRPELRDRASALMAAEGYKPLSIV